MQGRHLGDFFCSLFKDSLTCGHKKNQMSFLRRLNRIESRMMIYFVTAFYFILSLMSHKTQLLKESYTVKIFLSQILSYPAANVVFYSKVKLNSIGIPNLRQRKREPVKISIKYRLSQQLMISKFHTHILNG